MDKNRKLEFFFFSQRTAIYVIRCNVHSTPVRKTHLSIAVAGYMVHN